MNTRTDVQLIRGADGNPAFVVMPYAMYVEQYGRERQLIPNEVVGKMIEENLTPMRAWREYLGLTQTAVAERLAITQAAYAQLEVSARPRKSTLQRVASALGLAIEQLAV